MFLFFFFLINFCIWLCWVFTAAVSSLVATSGGYSLVAVQGLLVAVSSLVAEHRLESVQAPVAAHMGSVVVVLGL